MGGGTARENRYPKCRFPFRVGTTSYVIEDGLVGNLRFLADKVDEMQLVLFEAGGFSNIPTAKEVDELRRIARDTDTALTVHLPVTIELGDPDPAFRRASCELFRRVVEITAPLHPLGWVLHVVGSPEYSRREAIDPDRLARHAERTHENLARLMPLFDSPRDLCIENIHRHFFIEPPFIEAFETSTCVDVGHLVCHGQEVCEHLDAWLPRCRIMHLHGTNERGEDHASLAHLPNGFLENLFQRLKEGPSPETVTIEGNRQTRRTCQSPIICFTLRPTEISGGLHFL